MEGVDRGFGGAQRRDHDVAPWRSEAVRVREIEEALEEARGCDGDRAVPCDLDGSLRRADGHLAVAEERDLELARDRLGAIVDEVCVETAVALVAEVNGEGRAGAAHRPPCGLGRAVGADEAPTGPLPQITEEPDEAAAASRAGAPPFAEHRADDLGGRGASELEIALVIGVAERARVDAEEELHV